MITGHVTATLEATIDLKIRGPNGEQQVTALLDTGFNGFFTMHSALVAALGLSWFCRHQGHLADGSSQIIDAYEASIDWEGRTKTIEVLAIDAPSLAGMKLLQGSELRIEVESGGAVEINPLP
jgi:clan AA aspartic protease